MTVQKVQSVISLYREKLESLHVTKRDDIDHDSHLHSAHPDVQLAHCMGMLDKMEGFLAEGRIDKAYRWLGFMQGVFWSLGIYTLTEMMNHNRKDSGL